MSSPPSSMAAGLWGSLCCCCWRRKLRPLGDDENGNADAMSCCGRAVAKALARMTIISRSAAAASSSGKPCGNRQEEPFLHNPRA
uniref:Uncharacterized protein n=1 Tax=Arundo donax TaxID=35708 RepID=A0A0A9FUW1_ARUDO